MRPESGFRIALNGPYWKNDINITISRYRQFFWRRIVSLIKFSYWSKFHVNIITGSGVTKIFFYNELSRKLEIGNTPIWVLPNICRLGKVRDINLGTNVSKKILLKAAKYQCCSFYRFWAIKGKPKGGWGWG